MVDLVEVLVYVVFFLMLRFVTKSALMNLFVIVVCLNLKGQVFSCLAFFMPAVSQLSPGGRSAAATSRFGDGKHCLVRGHCYSSLDLDVQAAIRDDRLGVFSNVHAPFFCSASPARSPCRHRLKSWWRPPGNMTYSS